MSDDELRRQRALTAEFREALEAFGEDARELVREEVARALPDEAAVQQMMRAIAREEAERSAQGSRGISWPTAGAAAALTLAGLGLGWAGTAWLGGGDGGETVQAAVSPPVEQAPADPALRASLYDSLFASRDSALLAFSHGLDDVAAAEVVGPVSAWRSGSDSSAVVVHGALVQLALRLVTDTTLAVDGVLPPVVGCELPACLALLDHWRSTAGRDGYPALPPDGAPDSVAVAQVERLVVLRAAGIP